MKGYGKLVRAKLLENGCWFVRYAKADHDVWFSPVSRRSISVPVTIMSRHEILKQAAVPKAF